MSYRVGGGRVSDIDERSYYRDEPRRGHPRREYDDVTEIYERREERRSPPRRAPVREYEETDISIRERESRTPAFLREEPRRGEAGPLVLRSREIETIDRRRPRSPSPVRESEQIVMRRRSISPPPRRERERDPLPAPMPEIRRPRFIERSPSPGPEVRVDTRIIERRRERSPTPPPDREREIRIIERERQRVPSPSPSPPPPPPQPQVIRGPTIEREVITHYRDIDHGVERAPRPPSPPPPPRRERPREREREIDIDIYDSRGETEVDIHKRTRSRSRPRARPVPPPRGPSYYDDEVIVRSDRDRLKIDIEHDHRRSRSVAPPAPSRPDYSDEAEYITSKIDSRGQMGEAWHGATKDWTIVDVPPGTERVKMDGVGGGGAEVTWQRYNGVRRAKFNPERDGTVVSASNTSIAPEPVRESASDRDRLSVQIYDKHRDASRDRTVVEDVHDTRISIRDRDRDRERRPVKRQQEMWTEITKDLVVREAVERMGYEYEETEWFFYVMEYLRYEDVLQLVNLSDQIRKARKERAREIEWEREARERWERRHRHPRHRDHYDDERIVEHEVIYERDRKGSRQYLH